MGEEGEDGGFVMLPLPAVVFARVEALRKNQVRFLRSIFG